MCPFAGQNRDPLYSEMYGAGAKLSASSEWGSAPSAGTSMHCHLRFDRPLRCSSGENIFVSICIWVVIGDTTVFSSTYGHALLLSSFMRGITSVFFAFYCFSVFCCFYFIVVLFLYCCFCSFYLLFLYFIIVYFISHFGAHTLEESGV